MKTADTTPAGTVQVCAAPVWVKVVVTGPVVADDGSAIAKVKSAANRWSAVTRLTAPH
jgi:hypothetical protein